MQLVLLQLKGAKTEWVQVWAYLIRFAIYAVKSNQSSANYGLRKAAMFDWKLAAQNPDHV